MRTMRYPRPRREYRLQATVHARGALTVSVRRDNDIFGPCEHVLSSSPRPAGSFAAAGSCPGHCRRRGRHVGIRARAPRGALTRSHRIGGRGADPPHAVHATLAAVDPSDALGTTRVARFLPRRRARRLARRRRPVDVDPRVLRRARAGQERGRSRLRADARGGEAPQGDHGGDRAPLHGAQVRRHRRRHPRGSHGARLQARARAMDRPRRRGFASGGARAQT